MSRIRADKISNKDGTGAVQLQYGAEVPVGYGITGAGTININGNIQSANLSGGGAGITGINAGNISSGTIGAARLPSNLNTTGTAGGLTGTPDITVNNVVAAAATFSGNVSIGGTLTYEDVTNVDSVGLITARNGIKVGTGVTIESNGQATYTGIVTATEFYGGGGNLTGINAGPGTGESYVKLRTNTAASNIGNNTFAGYQAGNALGSNSGDHNTFYGINAGAANNAGQNNVFLGSNAGSVNVGGHENVAVGQGAYSNGTGDKNIAIGRRALQVTTSSDSSIGIGFEALMAQTNGGQSVAIGHQAALTVETGSQNVAVGHNALKLATSTHNTIVGAFAGDAIVGGEGNTALGRGALGALQSGSNCIAIGRDAAASSTSVSNEVTIGDANITKFRIPGIGCSITSQSLTAKGLSIGPGVLAEKVNVVSGSGFNGSYGHWVLSGGMVIYGGTNPASNTWQLDMLGNGSTTFNSLMAIGETTTVTMYAASDDTAKYMTAFKIDGTTQTVKWAGGTAPSAATGSGTDVYAMTIMKTADATFAVFGNLTNFA